MKKYKKRRNIDFLSILINLIIIAIIVGLAIFLYYCMSNDIEIKIAEFSDDFEITKIGTLESTTNIEMADVQNPLYSAEISNQTPEETEEIGYYYNQIDDNAKIIYNALAENEENLKTGNYTIEFGNKFNKLLNTENGTEQLNSSYQQALDAFSLDKPEVFYIDISKMFLMIYSRKTILKTTYTVSIKSEENSNYFIDGFNTQEEVKEAAKQVENVKLNLCNQLTGDNYNKIKQIHDCLVDNLQYEQTISKANIRNIYGALVTKEVVCEGYAKSFKYILDELNIPNIIVVGKATNSSNQTESHAWNYVYIDEKWYAIDVTWDDPIVIGGGRLPEKEKQKYFLKGSESFNINHIATGKVSENGLKFVYPELSLEDY